jgi:hypothetical protein
MPSNQTGRLCAATSTQRAANRALEVRVAPTQLWANAVAALSLSFCRRHQIYTDGHPAFRKLALTYCYAINVIRFLGHRWV